MRFIALIRCDSKKKGYRCMVGILNLWFFVSCPLLFAAYKEYIEKRHCKKKKNHTVNYFKSLASNLQCWSLSSCELSCAGLWKRNLLHCHLSPKEERQDFWIVQIPEYLLIEPFLLEVVTYMWRKYGLFVFAFGRWNSVFHYCSEFWDSGLSFGRKRAGIIASLIQEYLDLTTTRKIKYFHMIQPNSLGFYFGRKSQLMRKYCISYLPQLCIQGPLRRKHG